MLKINFKNKNVLAVISRDLFLTLFVLFFIFSFLELLKPRIITNYINLDIFLFILVLSGVFTIIFFPQAAKISQKLKFYDYSTIILFSVLIGILIFYLSRGIGLLSFLVGIVSAIITYLFIVLNLKSEV